MILKPKSAVGNTMALLYKRYTDIEKSFNANGTYKTQDNKYWKFDLENEEFVETNVRYSPINITTNSTRLRYRYRGNTIFGDPTAPYVIFFYDGTKWEDVLESELYETHFESATSTLSGVSIINISPYAWYQGANSSNTIKIKNNFPISIDITSGAIPFKEWSSTTQDLRYNGTSVTIPANTEITYTLNGTHQSTSGMNNMRFGVKPTTTGESGSGNIEVTTNILGTLDNLKFPTSQKYQINNYYYNGSFSYMLRGGVDTEDVQYIKGAITPTRTMEIKWFNDEIGIDHDDLVVIDGRLWVVNSVSWDIKRMPKPFKVYFATLTSIL